MAEREEWDEDSGIYTAIMDLNHDDVGRLESDWISGPHAGDVARAKENLAACRVAVEKIAALLEIKHTRTLGGQK